MVWPPVPDRKNWKYYLPRSVSKRAKSWTGLSWKTGAFRSQTWNRNEKRHSDTSPIPPYLHENKSTAALISQSRRMMGRDNALLYDGFFSFAVVRQIGFLFFAYMLNANFVDFIKIWKIISGTAVSPTQNMELTRENGYIFCPYCGQQFHIDN